MPRKLPFSPDSAQLCVAVGVATGGNDPRRCPMREQNQPSTSAPSAGEVRPRKKLVGSGRREFLEQVGVAATLAAGALESPSTASAQLGGTLGSGSLGSVSPPVGVTNPRVIQSFNNRVNAATAESLIPVPQQVTNGDETNVPNHIGNYSKGLIHNSIGEVDSSSYQSLLNAVNSGNPSAFDQIQLGGNTPLVDPQAGLAFDLEGTDSHQLAFGTPPSVASQSIADAAVENYWMALCRDVNFTQYGNEPLTAAAIAELNSLRACSHPKPVTPQNLFRGVMAGGSKRTGAFWTEPSRPQCPTCPQWPWACGLRPRGRAV